MRQREIVQVFILIYIILFGLLATPTSAFGQSKFTNTSPSIRNFERSMKTFHTDIFNHYDTEISYFTLGNTETYVYSLSFTDEDDVVFQFFYDMNHIYLYREVYRMKGNIMKKQTYGEQFVIAMHMNIITQAAEYFDHNYREVTPEVYDYLEKQFIGHIYTQVTNP